MMIVRECLVYIRDGEHLGGDLANECFGPVLGRCHVNDDGNFTRKLELSSLNNSLYL